jgi:hypothetical protein
VSLICKYHHKAVQTWLQKRRKKKRKEKRKRKKERKKKNYDQTRLKAFEVK